MANGLCVTDAGAATVALQQNEAVDAMAQIVARAKKGEPILLAKVPRVSAPCIKRVRLMRSVEPMATSHNPSRKSEP